MPSPWIKGIIGFLGTTRLFFSSKEILLPLFGISICLNII
jgi:hypothetical protein